MATQEGGVRTCVHSEDWWCLIGVIVQHGRNMVDMDSSILRKQH